jgi:hypothetical protein
VPVADQPCQQLYEGNPVLLGFDVVQYHFIPSVKDGGVAVRGKPEFAYNFEGYQFWFSTLENRQRFIGDPWRYAPAWGGFCSWGVGLEVEGWPWAIDFLGPPASPWNGWLIVDGVLTFNIWESYSDRFASNLDTNMALAAKRWSNWFGQGKHRFAGPFNTCTHCIGHGRLKNWCLSRQPSPWLADLPECKVEEVEVPEDMDTSVGLNTSSTSVVVSGGGIVSDADEFTDFSNARFSPHQQKMFKVGASIIVIFLVFLNLAFCYRKKLQKCCSRCRGRQEVGENQSNRKSDDDATTKKEEEGDVDSSDADGSNGKDSDTMVDEEEKV